MMSPTIGVAEREFGARTSNCAVSKRALSSWVSYAGAHAMATAAAGLGSFLVERGFLHGSG
jgi:hypothetical protein